MNDYIVLDIGGTKRGEKTPFARVWIILNWLKYTLSLRYRILTLK